MNRPFDGRARALLALVNVDLALLAGALYPFCGKRGLVVLVVITLALDAATLLGFRSWLARLGARPLPKKLLATASSILLLVGGSELVARGLQKLGRLPLYTPMTIGAPGADWRLYHITSDELREPDPVLLWRPVAKAPYSAQRFRGPVVSTPKPPGVFRVICYGDSNTDGPNEGGAWAERLQAFFAADRRPGQPVVEVLNAGVSGYSSWQGLRRFRQEVDRYEPDLVLVSFGWNDAAPTENGPDRSFRPPGPFLAAARNFLYHYRCVLAVMAIVDRQRASRPQPAPRPTVPRVSLDDYLANLEGFRSLAAEKKIRLAVLTRPMTPGQQVIPEAPRYNAALREQAARSAAPLVDVDALFSTRPDDFVDNCHFTGRGHRAMAEKLAAELDRQGLLPYLPLFPRYRWGSPIGMGQGGDGVQYLTAGWSPVEPTCVWNNGPAAGFRIPVERPTTQVVRIDARLAAFLVPGQLDEQRVEIRIDGEPAGVWTIRERGVVERSLEVPASLFRSDEVAIDLSFPNATAPVAIGYNEDRRRLAVGFHALALTPR